eukprot:m.602575 g.602575  ORF g.602575 m.602575 type:complete len:120 (+) comp22447_c0_seq2:2613-2972(+)
MLRLRAGHGTPLDLRLARRRPPPVPPVLAKGERHRVGQRNESNLLPASNLRAMSTETSSHPSAHVHMLARAKDVSTEEFECTLSDGTIAVLNCATQIVRTRKTVEAQAALCAKTASHVM